MIEKTIVVYWFGGIYIMVGSIGNVSPQGKAVRNESIEIENQIRNLQQQLKQIKKDKRMPPEARERKIKELQEEIAHLQQQKMQAGQENAQKTEDVSNESSEQITSAQTTAFDIVSSNSSRPKFDWYDKSPDKMEKTGLYHISNDENGDLLVVFDSLEEEIELNETDLAKVQQEDEENMLHPEGLEKPKKSDDPGGNSGGVVSEVETHCFCEGEKHDRETGTDCYVVVLSMADADGNPIDSPEVGKRISLNDLPNA